MTVQGQPQLSEAQIAVHWREEEYYDPSARFISHQSGERGGSGDPCAFRGGEAP